MKPDSSCLKFYICEEELNRNNLMKIPSKHQYRSGHSVELLRSGKSYFTACEEAIENAEHFIHFQTYIVDDDETGRRFVNALKKAAERGVRVYFLLDAYGGKSFPVQLVKEIEQSGVLFRRFSPGLISKDYQLSLRLHHKVLLIDGEHAIIGGMNVANRYHGLGGTREWLDFAVSVKGPECVHVLFIVKKLWNKAFLKKGERSHETIHNPVIHEENIRVKVLQNNWYRNKIEILKSYRSALKHANVRMIIMASYFLPGRNERKLLRNASRRGVDITIVLSAESDAPMVKRATNFLYRFILRNNIKIYEYLPSNLHAKVATVDGKWSTIGSYNLNHLSDYGSIEMNVNILDENFTSAFEQLLVKLINKDCREVTFDNYMHRKIWLNRLIDWSSYQMIRSILRIMFLLTSKGPKKHSV
jgi:cardiolipin synthase